MDSLSPIVGLKDLEIEGLLRGNLDLDRKKTSNRQSVVKLKIRLNKNFRRDII